MLLSLRIADPFPLSVLPAATIQDLEEEKARLERQVAAQNLTPEEVKRMTVEHSTLKESIPDLQNKLADGNKQQGEQEIAVTRRMDDIETLSQEYNGLINKLGLASGQRTDFTIAVEMNQGDMTGVGVVSARMKEEIRPALQAFGDQVRSDYQKRANRKIELDDELDKVSSERQAKEEEQKTLEMKLRIADDQADKFRTVSATHSRHFILFYGKLKHRPYRLLFHCSILNRKHTTCKNASPSSRRRSVQCQCQARMNFSGSNPSWRVFV